MLEGDGDGGGGAGFDCVFGLLGPGLEGFVGLVGGDDFVDGGEDGFDVGLVDVEDAVDGLAEDAGDGGLFGGETGAVFLDCGVDDLVALLEWQVVCELELGETGFELLQGR